MTDLEKLAKSIMAECEKDNEPVSYEEALEMAEMEIKEKGIKNTTGASKGKNTNKKPKTVKISNEKAQIFKDLCEFLTDFYKFEVVKDNKLIEIELNGKKFKLDLIETREKK